MEATELRDLSAAKPPTPRCRQSHRLRSTHAGTFAVPASRSACRTCSSTAGSAADAGATNTPHVYALGRIEARFPNLAAEKEFAQASGRADTAGKTDQETFHAVLSERDNRYLVRQLCWVLTIEGLETYLLRPRDPADIDLLVDAIRPAPSPSDVDVVIGWRGPIAPPEMCNGLMVPIVAFDQIYSFDRDALIKAIPKPGKDQCRAVPAGRRGTVQQDHASDRQCRRDQRAPRPELSRHALSRPSTRPRPTNLHATSR